MEALGSVLVLRCRAVARYGCTARSRVTWIPGSLGAQAAHMQVNVYSLQPGTTPVTCPCVVARKQLLLREQANVGPSATPYKIQTLYFQTDYHPVRVFSI